jgi:hypothetical protein
LRFPRKPISAPPFFSHSRFFPKIKPNYEISRLAHSDSDAPLTKYLGSDKWKMLPTNSPSNFCRGFLELYDAKLRKLGYSFIGNMQQVTTPGNVPLYYLFFASKHKLGEKIWNDTLKRVNDPELF